MADITLQLRSSKGSKRITIPGSSTFSQLKAAIEEATGVAMACQVIKSGYPPKVIEGDLDGEGLERVGIRHGETLIIEEDKSRAVPVATPPSESSSSTSPASHYPMIRRVIASDNSCLFNAVGYALEGHRRDVAPELRDIIAGFILSDPVTYCEALLGKPTEQYCEWIRRPESWGGAPELSILSQYYQVQIACVSIQTVRLDLFGDYPNRIYLLYDNIHYDILAKNDVPGAPEASDATVFPSTDLEAETGALDLARELQRKREFTDLSGCALMCGVCMKGLKGEKEAIRHGNETGHTNFQEVRR